MAPCFLEEPGSIGIAVDSSIPAEMLVEYLDRTNAGWLCRNEMSLQQCSKLCSVHLIRIVVFLLILYRRLLIPTSTRLAILIQ